MSKTVARAFLKSLGLNVLAGLAGLAPFLFLNADAALNWGFSLLIIAGLSLLLQIIIGLIYIFDPEKKETGQGMLISVGLLLLIGIGVCSPLII
jgi:hypothetical protein